MKTLKEMQAEAEYILTCSEEEFNELTKDHREAIERIANKMLSPEEMIKIVLDKLKKDNEPDISK